MRKGRRERTEIERKERKEKETKGSSRDDKRRNVCCSASSRHCGTPPKMSSLLDSAVKCCSSELLIQRMR